MPPKLASNRPTLRRDAPVAPSICPTRTPRRSKEKTNSRFSIGIGGVAIACTPQRRGLRQSSDPTGGSARHGGRFDERGAGNRGRRDNADMTAQPSTPQPGQQSTPQPVEQSREQPGERRGGTRPTEAFGAARERPSALAGLVIVRGGG